MALKKKLLICLLLPAGLGACSNDGKKDAAQSNPSLSQEAREFLNPAIGQTYQLQGNILTFTSDKTYKGTLSISVFSDAAGGTEKAFCVVNLEGNFVTRSKAQDLTRHNGAYHYYQSVVLNSASADESELSPAKNPKEICESYVSGLKKQSGEGQYYLDVNQDYIKLQDFSIGKLMTESLRAKLSLLQTSPIESDEGKVVYFVRGNAKVEILPEILQNFSGSYQHYERQVTVTVKDSKIIINDGRSIGYNLDSIVATAQGYNFKLSKANGYWNSSMDFNYCQTNQCRYEQLEKENVQIDFGYDDNKKKKLIRIFSKETPNSDFFVSK